MNLEKKITFKTIYKSSNCTFVPNIQKPLKDLPDLIDGKVLYVNKGEYNIQSWFKPLTINKKDILS